MTHLVPGGASALVAASGTAIEEWFWEFFAATLRNRNTRTAYLRAVRDFCCALEDRGVARLAEIRPFV